MNTPSRYRLQIVDMLTGEVVGGWRPGDKVEIDMVSDLSARLAKVSVGMFTRQATVIEVVAEQFRRMLYDLKARV